MADASGSETMQRNIQEARSSLQTAIAQLGLVLRFHRDVKALGVESYAAKAPGSITRPLTHAIKEYNDACDTMEAELMRARRVILYDMTKTNTPEHVKSEEAEGEPQSASAADASLLPSTEQNTATSYSEQQKPDKKPILLEDDEMEDLFGSGNSTSLSSPITTMNAAASASRPTPPLFSTTSIPSGQNAMKAGDSSGIGGDAQTNTSNMGLNLGDIPDTGSTSTNADFSGMSANDFNNLLASLGAGGGSQQQGGTGNLLGDFGTGNIDFSSFGGLFDGTSGGS